MKLTAVSSFLAFALVASSASAQQSTPTPSSHVKFMQ